MRPGSARQARGAAAKENGAHEKAKTPRAPRHTPSSALHTLTSAAQDDVEPARVLVQERRDVVDLPADEHPAGGFRRVRFEVGEGVELLSGRGVRGGRGGRGRGLGHVVWGVWGEAWEERGAEPMGRVSPLALFNLASIHPSLTERNAPAVLYLPPRAPLHTHTHTHTHIPGVVGWCVVRVMRRGRERGAANGRSDALNPSLSPSHPFPSIHFISEKRVASEPPLQPRALLSFNHPGVLSQESPIENGGKKGGKSHTQRALARRVGKSEKEKTRSLSCSHLTEGGRQGFKKNAARRRD